MDQVTEPKRRGRKPKAENIEAVQAVEVAQAPQEPAKDAPLFSIAVPAWIEDVPLNEQCPADVLLSLRSQIGVLCHFKDGRLICVDGRVFRVVVNGRTVEVFNG